MVCKIGIVGFGIVGKSFVALAASEKHKIGKVVGDATCDFAYAVWDQRTLNEQERAHAACVNANIVDANIISLEQFITDNDYVFVSPGIDIYPFRQLWHKCLAELDFFAPSFANKTIAITGSVGKTTTTKLLTKLITALQPDKITQSGGNIGRGMLELVSDATLCHTAVLELSSFQLDLNRSFAPDIAIWTNLYPNHLDRHHTQKAYFQAKAKLLHFQQSHQHALIPAELFDQSCLQWTQGLLAGLKSRLVICGLAPFEQDFLDFVPRPSFDIVWLENNRIFKAEVSNNRIKSHSQLCSLDGVPDVTFKQNWLYIAATLALQGIDPFQIQNIVHDSPVWDLSNKHRVQHCATINGVDFYDDSKSTMIQATQAAVDKLATTHRPIILIVGGLGKGVDRSPLMHWLAQNKSVKKVVCFGKECSQLFGAHQTCDTLEQALDCVFASMKSGDIVLFSPSGTSFDLFKNYEHRGMVFQELVKQRMIG